MAKIHDFDACGVWRPWILQKVSRKYSFVHLSYRAWKYKSYGGLVECVSAIFAEKMGHDYLVKSAIFRNLMTSLPV